MNSAEWQHKARAEFLDEVVQWAYRNDAWTWALGIWSACVFAAFVLGR